MAAAAVAVRRATRRAAQPSCRLSLATTRPPRAHPAARSPPRTGSPDPCLQRAAAPASPAAAAAPRHLAGPRARGACGGVGRAPPRRARPRAAGCALSVRARQAAPPSCSGAPPVRRARRRAPSAQLRARRAGWERRARPIQTARWTAGCCRGRSRATRRSGLAQPARRGQAAGRAVPSPAATALARAPAAPRSRWPALQCGGAGGLDRRWEARP